jgi:Putative prokaryotic signal transducing protein
MFCPECKSEYIEGILVCSECNKKLIEELPKEPPPKFIDYKELLSTYNPADIAFLKSLLESEGIHYFFKGENFMNVRPLADPARLMVRVDQVEETVRLLKTTKPTFFGITLDKRSKGH